MAKSKLSPKKSLSVRFEAIMQTSGDWLKVSKTNGIRVVFECDESQMPELVKLLALQEEVVTVTVEVSA